MKKLQYFACIISAVIFYSCEKEIEIDLPEYTPSVVVEGYVTNDNAPLVVLTKNVPVDSNTSLDLYEKSFIHNALVVVETDGETRDTLIEITNTNPANGLKTSFYTSQYTKGKVGKTYRLKVVTANSVLTSTATIPNPVKIKEIWYENHPENTELKTVWIKVNDPTGINYYRYTSIVNGETGPQPEISTLNDQSFDGLEIKKAIDSGLGNEEQDIHGGVAGYFKTSDTITVNWINAEKSYYNVWTTIDFKRSQNENPFLNPIRVSGNINGGLGYWSGLGIDQKTIILK